MKWKKSIFFIVLVAFFVRLLFFFDYHPLWWDSAVYAGMGKYIWSWAQQGLWEPLRPIFWPLLLGGIWKSGLDIVFFGRIITLIMSLAIIWFTYKISLTFYDGDIALISAALVSFSTLFFFYTFRLYTEIPALFFVLLGFFFLQKKMYLYSGMFVGIAFLTKFPAGIFLVSFLPLILDRKKYKPLIHYVVEEAKASGVEEIIFVVSQNKKFVVDYFKKSPRLEKLLEEQGKKDLIEQLHTIDKLGEGISFSYVTQKLLETENFKAQEKEGETYFIIHPVLKHISILSCLK